MMKIVIFGTGLFYKRRKQYIPDNVEILGFIDNNSELYSKTVDNCRVYDPRLLNTLDYDYIVLASIVPVEMKHQLIKLNIEENKILYWEEFISITSKGILKKYCSGNENRHNKNALIIVPIVNYAGGFMTAYYFARVLYSKNYNVTIAAPVVNNETVNEVISNNISIWECPSLPYINEVEKKWICEYDLVLCNSLQTMICVSELACKQKVLWWIHEHSRQYEHIVEQYKSHISIDNINKASVYCVSKLARNIFVKYFPTVNAEILPFGIEDNYNKNKEYEKSNSKIIFSTIGNISDLKNQCFVVECLDLLPDNYKEIIEYWIIGRDGGKEYKNKLIEVSRGKSYVKICGEYNRAQMKEALRNIDVVICPSKEETMSMTIIEGMMNEKICITNSNTGIAEYIENKIDGFIYENNNKLSLVEIILYVLNNDSNSIRKKARKKYLENFSIEVFDNKVNEIIVE